MAGGVAHLSQQVVNLANRLRSLGTGEHLVLINQKTRTLLSYQVIKLAKVFHQAGSSDQLIDRLIELLTGPKNGRFVVIIDKKSRVSLGWQIIEMDRVKEEKP